MKNRTGKTIVTLLAVIALLTGIMPFGSRKVEAATTQIVWEDDDLDDIDVTSEGTAASCTKDGIIITAEASSSFTLGFIIISSGKMTFSCDDSLGRITGLEIICDPNGVENFERDNPDWSMSTPDALHLVWKGEGDPEINFQMTEEDDGRLKINPDRMIFTLVSDDEKITEYPLWVGSRQVTSVYLSNETEGWSYDPDSKTLTLNNANITDTNTAYSVTSSCISTKEDLTISLSGNNTVGSIDSSSLAINSYDRVLTITGSGSLTVNSKKDCIEVTYKLIIDNTSVTINGYMKVGGAGFHISNGSEVKVTSASGSINVLGRLSIENSRLEATGDELAVLADRISISGNSEVKAVATKQTQRVITAIFATDSFEINGLEIVTPEDGKIIKGDAGIGKEVFTVCDKDGNVAKEVLIKSVTPEYTVTSGAGGTYTIDSGKDYTLAVKRNVNDGSCFERFAGVKLDREELTKDTDYTAVKGSTVITLKASTLSKLSEGEHTVTVSFIDGKAETSLTVKKASAPTPEPTPATPYQIPKTGIE